MVKVSLRSVQFRSTATFLLDPTNNGYPSTEPLLPDAEFNRSGNCSPLGRDGAGLARKQNSLTI